MEKSWFVIKIDFYLQKNIKNYAKAMHSLKSYCVTFALRSQVRPQGKPEKLVKKAIFTLLRERQTSNNNTVGNINKYIEDMSTKIKELTKSARKHKTIPAQQQTF